MHSIYYIRTTHYSRILTNQNKLFLRDIHTKSWYGYAGVLDDLILSGFRCAFSCMVQYSLCHGMDIGTCNIVHWSAATHHRIAYWTGFGVCIVLVLNVIRCSYHYFLDRILFHHDFHHDSCDYHWDFYGHLLPFDPHFRLSLHKLFWFCKCTTPWMFPPPDILLGYWIEHVSFGLIYVMFTFRTRIFYKGVPGFATYCPCGIWYPCMLVHLLEIYFKMIVGL